MSKSFPTPDEAMDVLTAEAALTALDGQRVKLLAREAAQSFTWASRSCCKPSRGMADEPQRSQDRTAVGPAIAARLAIGLGAARGLYQRAHLLAHAAEFSVSHRGGRGVRRSALAARELRRP